MATFNEIQLEIADMLAIPDEELTDERKALLEAYLEELAEMEREKIDSFAQFAKLELERAENIEEEGRRLSAKARAIKNRIQYLKSRYLGIMRARGLKKIAGKIYTVSVRETDVVCIQDPHAVPAEFWREKTERSVDKLAIRDLLKQGGEVPGCALEPSFSLQMR